MAFCYYYNDHCDKEVMDKNGSQTPPAVFAVVDECASPGVRPKSTGSAVVRPGNRAPNYKKRSTGGEDEVDTEVPAKRAVNVVSETVPLHMKGPENA